MNSIDTTANSVPRRTGQSVVLNANNEAPKIPDASFTDGFGMDCPINARGTEGVKEVALPIGNPNSKAGLEKSALFRWSAANECVSDGSWRRQTHAISRQANRILELDTESFRFFSGFFN